MNDGVTSLRPPAVSVTYVLCQFDAEKITRYAVIKTTSGLQFYNSAGNPRHYSWLLLLLSDWLGYNSTGGNQSQCEKAQTELLVRFESSGTAQESTKSEFM